MSSKLEFRLAKNSEDFTLAFPLVAILNPELSSERYLEYVDDMLDLGNYFLYLAYDGNQLVGICGYWIATKFYTGKYMEIDNFIISPKFQNNSYGSQFLLFLESKARALKCCVVMLDAYVENFSGHRFYYRNGYIARGYHFIKKMD